MVNPRHSREDLALLPPHLVLMPDTVFCKAGSSFWTCPFMRNPYHTAALLLFIGDSRWCGDGFCQAPFPLHTAARSIADDLDISVLRQETVP